MPASARRPLAPDSRILLLRLSAMGDILFALPALRALRLLYPEARLEWLVEDRHAALLQSHPDLDEVLVFPRRRWGGAGGTRALLRHLRGLRRRPRYDWILDFQGNLKSALQLLFLRREHSVGFAPGTAREGSHFFVGERVAIPPRTHRVERDLALVRHLGWEGSAPTCPRWPLEGELPALEGPAPVLLHTAVTAYGRDKEWPVERWGELARALAERGVPVEILWTPADRPRAETVLAAAGSGGGIRLAPPTPSLSELALLCDRAALVIGCDSGPIHLAALRGTPVLALFGPTDPAIYAPFGPRVRTVSSLPPGQPPPPRNRRRRSPLMDSLSTSSVLSAALTLLAG